MIFLWYSDEVIYLKTILKLKTEIFYTFSNLKHIDLTGKLTKSREYKAIYNRIEFRSLSLEDLWQDLGADDRLCNAEHNRLIQLIQVR